MQFLQGDVRHVAAWNQGEDDQDGRQVCLVGGVVLRDVDLHEERGKENSEQEPLGRLGEAVVLEVDERLIVTASCGGEDEGEGKTFEAGACVPLPVDLDCDEAEKDGHDDLRRGARSEEDQHAREHEAPCTLEDFEPKGVALVLQAGTIGDVSSEHNSAKAPAWPGCGAYMGLPKRTARACPGFPPHFPLPRRIDA